jgi:hypothetical protein
MYGINKTLVYKMAVCMMLMTPEEPHRIYDA